jgi:hypothetical protein
LSVLLRLYRWRLGRVCSRPENEAGLCRLDWRLNGEE